MVAPTVVVPAADVDGAVDVPDEADVCLAPPDGVGSGDDEDEHAASNSADAAMIATTIERFTPAKSGSRAA